MICLVFCFAGDASDGDCEEDGNCERNATDARGRGLLYFELVVVCFERASLSCHPQLLQASQTTVSGGLVGPTSQLASMVGHPSKLKLRCGPTS
jgi:hypothetical protein